MKIGVHRAHINSVIIYEDGSIFEKFCTKPMQRIIEAYAIIFRYTTLHNDLRGWVKYCIFMNFWYKKMYFMHYSEFGY